MSKHYRKKDTGITSDIKDLGILCIGFSILFAVWLIAICIQVMIEYWYVSVPALACISYAYLKSRTIEPVQPQPSYRVVNTIEDIKINNGTRKTRTTEKYDPVIPTGTKILNRFL